MNLLINFKAPQMQRHSLVLVTILLLCCIFLVQPLHTVLNVGVLLEEPFTDENIFAVAGDYITKFSLTDYNRNETVQSFMPSANHTFSFKFSFEYTRGNPSVAAQLARKLITVR